MSKKLLFVGVLLYFSTIMSPFVFAESKSTIQDILTNSYKIKLQIPDVEAAGYSKTITEELVAYKSNHSLVVLDEAQVVLNKSGVSTQLGKADEYINVTLKKEDGGEVVATIGEYKNKKMISSKWIQLNPTVSKEDEKIPEIKSSDATVAQAPDKKPEIKPETKPETKPDTKPAADAVIKPSDISKKPSTNQKN